MRSWFTEHPLYDAEGQPIVVPEWQFPARGRVKKQLQRAKTMAEKTERVLQALPLRGKQATWAAKLDETKTDIDRAYQYVQLYGLYTECEAIYQVDQLMRIHDGLDAADQAAFNIDPRSVDWPTYVSTIHLPSIVHHSRAKTKPGKSRNDRADRLRRSVLSPDRHVAAFDLENTLIASNVVESYSWSGDPPAEHAGADSLRAAHAGRGTEPQRDGPQGSRRLPAVLLPPVRGRPGQPDRRGLERAADQPDPDQELPARHPPGARAPGARPSHDPDHRARSTSPCRACGHCSTRSSPPR